MDKCGVSLHKVNKVKHNKIHGLQYCGNRVVMKIMQYLDAGSTQDIRLERKYVLWHSPFFLELNGIENLHCKPVVVTEISSGNKTDFTSLVGAATALGLNQKSTSECLNGRQKTHRGFTFSFKTEK